MFSTCASQNLSANSGRAMSSFVVERSLLPQHLQHFNTAFGEHKSAVVWMAGVFVSDNKTHSSERPAERREGAPAIIPSVLHTVSLQRGAAAGNCSLLLAGANMMENGGGGGGSGVRNRGQQWRSY